MREYAWLIAFIPFVSWLLIAFFGHRFKHGGDKIGIVALTISLVLATMVLVETANVAMQGEALGAHGPALAAAAAQAPEMKGESPDIGPTFDRSITWIKIGSIDITTGFQVDPLTAVMLFMVSLVSLMVHVFSQGYMHGDVRYTRFYATLSLFTAAMLTLLLADNYILFVISWEVMGLCSYLLIGHWFEKPGPMMASMKAFITTRIGDVGMLLGIFLTYWATGSFAFKDIAAATAAGKVAGPMLTAMAVLIFMGAVGKSAQFPLHVWLPDAMEGPTPVSALIHAATMVAAGVYLVARSYPIFHLTGEALAVVAYIGGFTALFAASIATLAQDIKKVLAYSTISQLGYMVMALGVGGYTAGVFHLLTHAFFKSLLFLGSGSVIHALHTQDMHEMGGLSKKMKVTTWTFIIGTLALAGVFPFAGFWSKDEILLAAFNSPFKLLFWVGILVAFMTAYYMTRAVTLTFFGKPRDHHKFEHAHESPSNMTVPLIILAVFATFSGLVNSPLTGNWFAKFVHFGAEHGETSLLVTGLATAAALLGILVGYAIYGWNVIDRKKAIRAAGPLYTALKNKWYIDEIYDATVVRAYMAFSAFTAWFDQHVIDLVVNVVGWAGYQMGLACGDFDLEVVDGAVNGVGAGVMAGGSRIRRVQTGYLQAYALALFGAVILGIIVYQVIGG